MEPSGHSRSANEGKYWRDHVEEHILGRLTKVLDTDRDIHPAIRTLIELRVEPVIRNIANKTFIPGFSPEDLESFFWMKTNQVLRQGKYDGSRPAEVFFGVIYKNLIRDIMRMRENAINRGMEIDAMDMNLPFFDGVHANQEEE